MRVSSVVVCCASAVVIACADGHPSDPANQSVWGDDQSALVVRADGVTLQRLASGGCVGSYATSTTPINSLSFDLPATYTQYVGAAPGHLDYPATISGAFRDDHMRLTVVVPAIGLTLGPLDLIKGVAHSWESCRYP
ncbi:MAG: hypothetical protein U0132_19695 [Gemmatimonadaceae bacterium]